MARGGAWREAPESGRLTRPLVLSRPRNARADYPPRVHVALAQATIARVNNHDLAARATDPRPAARHDGRDPLRCRLSALVAEPGSDVPRLHTHPSRHVDRRVPHV